MATTTTNLSLTKPAVNDPVDQDKWGDQLNANMDTLDSEAVTKTVALDFADFELSRPKLKDYSETAYNAGNVSGAVALDYTNGNYQYATATGNITSLTISNWPASGSLGSFTLELSQDGTGSRTLTLSSAYKTEGGAGITLTTTASATDILTFLTRDAGSTIYTNGTFTWS